MTGPRKYQVRALTLAGRRSSIDGGSGLDYVVKAIAHVLHPGRSESGGLFVGDLILALLRKAGDLVLPILPDLLKALMDRLALAKSATFTQVG